MWCDEQVENSISSAATVHVDNKTAVRNKNLNIHADGKLKSSQNLEMKTQETFATKDIATTETGSTSHTKEKRRKKHIHCAMLGVIRKYRYFF